MSRVFLTGATGFIGSYIARLLLQKGYEVTAIKRASSKLNLVSDIHEKIQWIEADLGDIKDMEIGISEADYIIHAAALVSFQPKDRMAMYDTNVVATHDLVNLALIHGIKKFIHLSSIAALGRHKNNTMLDENAEWQDSPHNTNYAISKQLGEREVWRGFAEGLAVAILNPSLVLGAGDWSKGTPAMFSKMRKGNPFYPAGSTGVVDVRDVAEIAVKALENESVGERYIISADNFSYRHILNKIAEGINVKLPQFRLTTIFAALIWRADAVLSFITRKPRIVTKENLAAASRTASYNNQKSIDTFQYNYRSINKTIQLSGELYCISRQKGNDCSIMEF